MRMSMRRLLHACAIAFLLMASCTRRKEPCPVGMVSDREKDRCVDKNLAPSTRDASTDVDAAQTVPDASPMRQPDAGTEHSDTDSSMAAPDATSVQLPDA